MGRHSIKFKITLLLTVIISSLLVLLVILNTTMSEKFYLSDRRKQMLEGYAYINEAIVSYTNGTISKDKMEDKIEQFTSGAAIAVIVVNSDWTTLYTNNNGEAEMINRLRMSIFNRDIFGTSDGSSSKSGEGEKNEEGEKSGEGEGGAQNGEDYKKFPKDDNGQTDVSIDMEQSGIEEKREIIIENEKYTLQKVYDERLSDDYYELWGTLDNGCSIMMRVSIQGIKDNVNIFNKFVTYIGLATLAVGIVTAYIFSGYISKPIKQLSNLAERMADMDFDAKYDGNDKGEIGVLGKSMNNMSEKLQQNISRLKSANIELQRDIDKKIKLEEMRTDFLSNVSHELKTPIALIQGYAEGLKEGVTDDPESMDFYCDVIIDEANKMNNMVKKLLTLNQIEFGDEETIMERFDLIELLSSVVSANALRASQQDITISFEPDEKNMYVWADEYKVEEMITNYISNAINHCEFEKRIIVRAVRIQDNIRVYVFNTGKHIPDEDIENIWVKFYKVDKARTRAYGGNGIGLSIVKAISESFGKECGVENVEGGVEFWFDLDAKA